MIEVTIPGRGDFTLKHLALDTNGTVSLDGQLIDGVVERLRALHEHVEIHLLTADTFGTVTQIERELGFPAVRIHSSADKADYVERLGHKSVVAVGNGANDAAMLSVAVLGIAILGPEGLAREAMEEADLIAPGILPALDLLLNSRRLTATLRR